MIVTFYTQCSESMRDQLQSLSVQGSLVGDREDIRDRLWAKAVKLVPERVMKFALNAVSDTLPHRSNLKKCLVMINVHFAKKNRLYLMFKLLF